MINMSEYCNVHLRSVRKSQLGNYIVRKGIDGEGEIVQPTERVLGWRYQLKSGVYMCQYDGLEETENCPIEKIFTVDEQELGKSKKLVIPKIRMDHVEAEGQQSIFLYSDQLEEKFYDNDDVSLGKMDGYRELGQFSELSFDTPAFRENKTINQFTTNSERIEFLNGLKDVNRSGCNSYHLYDYGFQVVILSRETLTGDDLFRDLETLKNSNRLNVMYQAQVHGNEFAAGEGALTVIEKLLEDDSCLDLLNIVIIPCVNQIGNTQSTRDCGKININRDFLKCEADETEKLHDVFFGFMPELVIDAHTFTRRNSFIGDSLKRAMFDVRISGASTTNIDEEIDRINQEIVETVIDRVNSQGLRAGYYSNSVNCNLGRLYYGLLGGCSVLFESEGTRSGKFHYRRNVASQVKGILSIISFACREKERIKKAVAMNRKKFVDGSNINRKYTFNHKSSRNNDQVVKLAEYDAFGRLIDEQAETRYIRYDEPVRLVTVPGKINFERDWFEREMEVLFRKNHVVYEKGQGCVTVDMNQVAQFVVIELLRDTDGEV